MRVVRFQTEVNPSFQKPYYNIQECLPSLVCMFYITASLFFRLSLIDRIFYFPHSSLVEWSKLLDWWSQWLQLPTCKLHLTQVSWNTQNDPLDVCLWEYWGSTVDLWKKTVTDLLTSTRHFKMWCTCRPSDLKVEGRRFKSTSIII